MISKLASSLPISQPSSVKKRVLYGIGLLLAVLLTIHLFPRTPQLQRLITRPGPAGNNSVSMPSAPFFSASSSRGGVKERYWTTSSLGGLDGLGSFEKPAGLDKIVAMVFYGRPETVSILECYLRRNLVKNGGMLDEVAWIVLTDDPERLDFLDKILDMDEAYVKWDVGYNRSEGIGYKRPYDPIQNGTMYLKIDDDVVFIEDTVVPSMVHTKWTHPEHFTITANVMNQPMISWIHWHTGAVKPYLPDLSFHEQQGQVDWRASQLPSWRGPSDFKMSLDWKPVSTKIKHRWLPLRPKASVRSPIDVTPVMQAEYDAWGKSLKHWVIAAQMHFSFLENLENNELWRYKFNTWDFHYDRLGIQFIAIWGNDVNSVRPVDSDDERFFSTEITKRTGRHGVMEGRGIVAHYGFGPQREGLATTDVLDRYRSFAEQHICPAGTMLALPKKSGKDGEAEEEEEW